VHQINRVPVVKEGRLIGVVTRGDVLGEVAHMTRPAIDLTSSPVRVGSDSHQGVGI
jgi:signal-transduction protein with cAMP-binding, CBS, and nucleotidyltransferase domain